MDNPVTLALPDPLRPVEVSGQVQAKEEDDNKSNVLSLPSNATDDLIGFSDIPIMKVSNSQSSQNTDGLNNTSKPIGSAFIAIRLGLGKTKNIVEARVCVDTGADMTLCSSAYLTNHFGNNVLKHIVEMKDPPKLKSASGHHLKILGKVNLTLYLGEYEMISHVLVHESTANIFLLGSDSFYDRLIFDRGLFLQFADKRYPPIPIQYQLSKGIAKTVTQYNVAPRSHALIQVKVTDDPQLIGKEVILSTLNEEESDDILCCKHQDCTVHSDPVRNSVSIIDSQGKAILLIQNETEDILMIQNDMQIAKVDLISDRTDEYGVYHVTQTPANDELIFDELYKPWPEMEEPWPMSALKGELRDKLPSNVIVNWDKISTPVQNVNYIHDKEERKNLLDGTGEGFPTPPAADSVHSEAKLSEDPESWLGDVAHSHLSDSEWTKLRALLIKHRDAFSKSKTEIGCCKYFKVDLPLKPGTGYLYNKPRPLPFKHREIAAETISELLAKGVIRPSKSPHATNIVCVRKKAVNGVASHRVCCDLRQVNEHSIPNRFPNYWIDDAMSKLLDAALRSAMDFKDAFHMLMLTKESIPVTAFYFGNVLFEYVRVPFGHVCAMNAFCCLMALLCVGYDPASYYADDLMITTKANPQLSRDQIFDQHLDHIGGMLVRIIDAGLKLVAHKCHWCFGADQPMDWLGFTMENNLLKPQESKVKAIQEFPVPTSSKQVISFISTASFYRRFIKSFAKEVQPMYAVANAETFVWTAEAQKSFEKLKEIMCSELVLRLPRQGEPFQIYSDASAGAIGVVLCQVDPIDKKSHPCAFGSRKFNDCEMKLSIPCKELLAIIYGLNLWSFYICGNPVHVYSDCRAWTFLKMQSGASGKISRLALLISEYDISISYIKGTANKAADGLSRAYDDGLTKYDDQVTARHPALEMLQAPELPEGTILKLDDYLVQCEDFLSTHWPKILKEYELRNPEVEKLNVPGRTEAQYVEQTIQEAAILHVDRSGSAIWRKRLEMDVKYPFQVSDDVIDEELTSFTDSESESSTDDESEEGDHDTTDSSFKAACFNIRLVAINESCFTIPAYAEMQAEDQFCSSKITLVKAKDPKTLKSGYFIKRSILMRRMETRDGQVYNVICVPEILRKPLMESNHRSLLCGHFGSQRYSLNMSRKYFWPNMKEEIEDFHHHCLPCLYNDKYPVKYLSGHVIRPLWPMHVVHCDLVVGMPKAMDGSYAILLLYDGFSRFTYGVPLTSEKADYIVKKLMSHYVAAFGLPWALHSDNGRNIDGALIRHLALLLGVLKTSTPPHTPNANPTETMCGAVGMLLRKALNDSDKRYWSLCLPFILNALNSTTHTATGYTPNSLFFGKFQERDLVPLVPFDSETANVNEYFQKLRRFQELSFQIVRSRNERKLLAKKESWDVTARTHSYKPGDFVLVKNNNPASGPGRKKLRAIYIGPFRVLKAYISSLIVVPWTENSRLEEYYKDPDLFRMMHHGDIKPFHTRQVSVKHCKPFRGKLETEHIIDPIMMNRFLDALGVDSQDEIISVIDSSDSDSSGGPPGLMPPLLGDGGQDQPGNQGSDSSSGSDDPGQGPNPDPVQVAPQLPPVVVLQQGDPLAPDPALQLDNAELTPEQLELIHRHAGDPVVGRLLDNLDMPEEDKALFREFYRAKAQTEFSVKTRSQLRKVDELEQLVRSPNPAIRARAEFELAEALDQVRLDALRSRTEAAESTSSDSNGSTLQTVKSNQGASLQGDFEQEAPDEADLEQQDMPGLEWDNEDLEQGPLPAPAQEINIKTPDVAINIRPFVPGGIADKPRLGRTPVERRKQDVQDWVAKSSPLHGAGPSKSVRITTPVVTPGVITRHGRVSKPAQRYDPALEDLKQREARELAKADQRSKKLGKGRSPLPTEKQTAMKSTKTVRSPTLPVKGTTVVHPEVVTPSETPDVPAEGVKVDEKVETDSSFNPFAKRSMKTARSPPTKSQVVPEEDIQSSTSQPSTSKGPKPTGSVEW